MLKYSCSKKELFKKRIYAPIAQWIECQPAELKIQVRFLLGAPLNKNPGQKPGFLFNGGAELSVVPSCVASCFLRHSEIF